MGDLSFQNNVPDPLLSGKELPAFKFELEKSKGKALGDSFGKEASIPPGYLLPGSRQELLQRVETLRDALSKMSPDQLKVNEITEDDRRVQMSLYEKLSSFLRAAK